jgi:hypothetical protein
MTTIGGQGSDNGSGNGSDGLPPERRILSVAFAAEIAAASTSSRNSSSALSRPARRAIASTILSSIATIPFRSDAAEPLTDINTTKKSGHVGS